MNKTQHIESPTLAVQGCGVASAMVCASLWESEGMAKPVIRLVTIARMARKRRMNENNLDFWVVAKNDDCWKVERSVGVVWTGTLWRGS